MNERIRELVEQATTVVEGWPPFEAWSDENGTTQYYEFDKQKFAELIVQECMSIIKQGDGLGNEDDFDKGFQAGIAMAYNRIRAQMGVEE